jgi:hypothetical protein
MFLHNVLARKIYPTLLRPREGEGEGGGEAREKAIERRGRRWWRGDGEAKEKVMERRWRGL